MTLYKNKYRIETARLKNWDYASLGLYFVTICTINKDHFFGEVENGEMILSDIGIIVQNEWIKTPSIRPDMNLTLDEFVVMPNHFHAIISIGKNEFNIRRDGMHSVSDRNVGDGMHPVSDRNIGDGMHPVSTDNNDNKFGPQSKNLGSIIRGLKSSVSIQVRRIVPEFGWQGRYHDHIIRDEGSYLRIQQYILDNPKNWKEDRFYS